MAYLRGAEEIESGGGGGGEEEKKWLCLSLEMKKEEVWHWMLGLFIVLVG